MLRGRVQVSVPEVFGDGRLAWAEPCVPYAGDQVGDFALPPVGASALGRSSSAATPTSRCSPGCLWQAGESPAPGLEQSRCSPTDAVTVTLSDVPGGGGVTVEVGPPAVPMPMKLALGPSRHRALRGGSSIVLDGVKVSINNGALEVT